MEINVWTLSIIFLVVTGALMLRIIWNWLRQNLRIAPLIIGIPIVISLAVCAIIFIPQFQTANLAGRIANTRFDAENEARKTVLQIIAGLVVIVGVYLTWRRILSMEMTVEVDRDRINLEHTKSSLDRRKLIMDRDEQLTDRYAKAVGLFGSDNQTIRLGGIYALERVAKDSTPDYFPVMEVLTTSVRINFPCPGSRHFAQTPSCLTHDDFQAIMDVIGRRQEEQINRNIGNNPRLDLKDVDFSGLNLKNARLQGINFFRSLFLETDLREAKLLDTSFYKADLSGAKLQGAKLQKTQLHGAILKGANIKEADLSTAENLTAGQVILAKNWHEAILPPELEVELVAEKAEIIDEELALDQRLSPR